MESKKMKDLCLFVRWAFEIAVVEGCDFDGGEVQLKMAELGLIRQEKYSEEHHGLVVDPGAFEEGDPIFLLSGWVEGAIHE